MLDLNTLNKYDPQGMHGVYNKWPEIAKISYESKQDIADFKNIEHVVFVGMGGSGALGDIFSSILSKTKIHVDVVKGYHLPSTVDFNSLVVTTSISGNTVETLSVLDAAYKSGCKLMAFSAGGKMQEYCSKHKIEYRNIPQIHSPRASFPRFLYSILKVLEPILPVKEKDVLDSIEELEKASTKISSENLTENNPAISLATWISCIPIIYYPFGLQAAAVRFKNSLQENAKKHAMMEDVIEACHNNIVSWERPDNIQPILLEGADDYIKTKERWNILKEYFITNKIEHREVHSVKGSIISKLINLIYFLDFTSIYRAVLSNVDPSPVRSIDFMKDMINKTS